MTHTERLVSGHAVASTHVNQLIAVMGGAQIGHSLIVRPFQVIHKSRCSLLRRLSQALRAIRIAAKGIEEETHSSRRTAVEWRFDR